MYKKIFLAGMITLLFIGIAVAPATAQMNLTEDTSYQETRTIERFMDDVETIAAESQTFSEFMEKLQTICLTNEYFKYPIVQEVMTKILQLLTKERALSTSGLGLSGPSWGILLKT